MINILKFFLTSQIKNLFFKKKFLILLLTFLFATIVLSLGTVFIGDLDPIYPRYETSTDAYLYMPLSESARIPMAVTNTPLTIFFYQPFWWANSTENIPYMPELDLPVFSGAGNVRETFYFETPLNIYDYFIRFPGDNLNIFGGQQQIIPEVIPPSPDQL